MTHSDFTPGKKLIANNNNNDIIDYQLILTTQQFIKDIGSICT